MSDPQKSGAPDQGPADLSAPATAPAEAAQTAVPSAAPVSAPVFGSFGATRGSGLARGKRPASVTAPTNASSGGYKPTALEVITPVTEYKNPFTGETSVSAPRANEPVPTAAPLPPRAVIEEAVPSRSSHSPIPDSSASLDAAARSDSGLPAGQTTQPNALPESPGVSENSAKSELNILPPETPRRAALRWESNNPVGAAPAEPASRPDERRTFQPSRERRDNREGREGRPFEPREPRPPREGGRDPREPRSFEPREPRRDERKFEPRAPQPQQDRTPAPQPEKKPGGFVGWLKGIFGGKPDSDAAPQAGGPAGDTRREHESRHGGHRGGGRGRGGSGGQGGYRGDNRGPRDQPQRGEGGQSFQGGENRGEPRGEGEYGGQRRRRRRGGRGRYRGEGGGGGGDRGPHPEGQQGGGAI